MGKREALSSNPSTRKKLYWLVRFLIKKNKEILGKGGLLEWMILLANQGLECSAEMKTIALSR
jgi:hypothetical protein